METVVCRLTQKFSAEKFFFFSFCNENSLEFLTAFEGKIDGLSERFCK